MKKKITSQLSLSLLIVFAFVFTSCNENNEIDKPELELHGLSNLKLDIKFGLSKKTPLKEEMEKWNSKFVLSLLRENKLSFFSFFAHFPRKKSYQSLKDRP